MGIIFKDKNGSIISIGDTVKPDDGWSSRIVSIVNVPDYGGDVMFGQCLNNPMCFDILTSQNLATQFTKIS